MTYIDVSAVLNNTPEDISQQHFSNIHVYVYPLPEEQGGAGRPAARHTTRFPLNLPARRR
jgi:hypothetical protein